MRLRITVSTGLAALVAAPALVAQDNDGAVMAVYYECDQAREGDLDAVIQSAFTPIFDRHLDAGHLTGWGWSTHVVGGKWRRLSYFISPSRDVLLDTRAQIISDVQNEQAAAGGMLTSVCPAHEDYIWNFVATSQAAADVAQGDTAASISSYYVCNQAQESRVDQIVAETVGPIFERHVEAGHLSGWSWLSHDAGGQFRRIATMSGPDHKSVLNGRDMVTADWTAESPTTLEEFMSICSSHEDYLWTSVVSR